ncbi:unnamed protein product [Laminaria digitata]
MWKELQLSAPARLLNAFQAHAPFTTAAATTGSGDESTLRLRGTSRRRAPRCARSSDSPWLPRPVSKPAYPRESVRKLWASVVDNEQSVGPGVIAADPIAGKRQRVVPRGDSRGARSKLIQNLKSLGRSGQWIEALAQAQASRADGIVFDVFMYSVLISAVASSGRWEEALALLDVMRSESVPPDHFAFGAAVNACAKGGQWQRAVELLDQVRSRIFVCMLCVFVVVLGGSRRQICKLCTGSAFFCRPSY